MNIKLSPSQLTQMVRLIEEHNVDRFLIEFRPDSDRSTKQKWWRRLHERLSQHEGTVIRSDTFQNIERVLTSSAGELSRELKLKTAVLPTSSQSLTNRSYRRMMILAEKFGLESELNHLEERDVRELPDELRLAIASLYSLAQAAWLSEIDIKPRDSARIFVTQTEASYDSLGKLQSELRQVLENLDMGKIEDLGSDDFSITTSQDSALFLQQICVFPFTMSRSRRPHFGVIPYARQQMIGMVMHKTHPSFQWMTNGMNSCLPEEVEVGVKRNNKERVRVHIVQDNQASQWLPRVISVTGAQGGKVVSITGDVQQSILFEALHQQAKENYGQSVEAINLLETIQLRKNRPEKNSTSNRSLFNWEELGLNTRGIFLFDPWEAEHFDTFNEYEYVLIPHNVDIKVGIGFSSNLILPLLVKDRWRKLLKAARDAFNQPGRKKSLAKFGVELLDNDFR